MKALQNLLIFSGALLLGAWLQASWDESAFQRQAAARLRALGTPPAAAQGTARRTRGEVQRSGILGRLEIPRLGLDIAVGEGIAERTLAKAVGHVPGTAFPGEAGNVGLAGHRDTFFRRLDRLDIGDRISMSTPDGTFEYRVSRRLVVRPRDTRVLENGSADLTLVTCYPMRAIGPAPDRFVVQARRVPDGQSASR